MALSLASIADASPSRHELVLYADLDDDDNDGVSDGQSVPKGLAAKDVRWLDLKRTGPALTEFEGSAVRIIADTRVVDKAPSSAARRFGLQGLDAGLSEIQFSKTKLAVSVIELRALDEGGDRVDLATSHASISRILPAALRSSDDRTADSDALRWLALGPRKHLPKRVSLLSFRPDGDLLEKLEGVPLSPSACPEGTARGFSCAQTPLIRAVSDRIDSTHPGSAGHSLRAEVGGRIVVKVAGTKAASIRVGGPRKTALGPLSRFRGRVRAHVIRVTKGGAVPVGGDERGAVSVIRKELRVASSLWGQCGIHFGYGDQLQIEVVDPPPAHMLAVGCDLGLPASGGQLRFRAGNQRFELVTEPGQAPIQVANAVAELVRGAGLKASVSVNARISQGALPTADVLIRRPGGGLLAVSPDGDLLSNDPTLNVCLGEVDLADGITHFTDFDAAAGTVEERSLIKAFEDGDPTTIELFVIANFARSGRIGESFIYTDGSSVRNAVILDRAGVRAGARSYALAHELGHILLDMPGHPDDFGVDQPSSLMDADAADPTIFGPRRLTVAECERAIRQSGPDAPVPLLEGWPMYKPKRDLYRPKRAVAKPAKPKRAVAEPKRGLAKPAKP